MRRYFLAVARITGFACASLFAGATNLQTGTLRSALCALVAGVLFWLSINCHHDTGPRSITRGVAGAPVLPKPPPRGVTGRRLLGLLAAWRQ